MAEFAIFRVQKLCRGSSGSHSIVKAVRHLEKHLQSAVISKPELSHLNRSKLFCEDYRKEIKKAIETHNANSNKKLRCDASIGFEMIFTHSKEVKINEEDYYKCIKQFISEEFEGITPIALSFHADETCPHFHLIALATTPQCQISTRAFLGDRSRLSYLQDRFAETCKEIGLKRGRKYTGYKDKPHHLSLQRHRAKMINDITRLKALREQLANAIDRELCR